MIYLEASNSEKLFESVKVVREPAMIECVIAISRYHYIGKVHLELMKILMKFYDVNQDGVELWKYSLFRFSMIQAGFDLRLLSKN